MKIDITKEDYEAWAQFICPCLNPYCLPRQFAICQGTKISPAQHKEMLSNDWLQELGVVDRPSQYRAGM